MLLAGKEPPAPQPAVTPLRATVLTKSWKRFGGSHVQEVHPHVLLGHRVTCRRSFARLDRRCSASWSPARPASNTICRDPWPAVMTPPPDRVQVQLDPVVVDDAGGGARGADGHRGRSGDDRQRRGDVDADRGAGDVALRVAAVGGGDDERVRRGRRGASRRACSSNGSERPVAGSHEQEDSAGSAQLHGVVRCRSSRCREAAAVGRVLTVKPGPGTTRSSGRIRR